MRARYIHLWEKKSYGKTRQTSLKKDFQNAVFLNIAIDLWHIWYIVTTQILTVKYLNE